MPVETKESGRRSQQERRDKTRGALLDAAIECLLELGYNNTSTTEIQRRAKVSRGALLHYFPSKASLMTEVIHYLALLRGRELHKSTKQLPEGCDRIQTALSLLWESFSGALFQVAMELRAAARTDPELRTELVLTELRLRTDIFSQFRKIFGPRFSSHPAFEDALELTIQMMAGLAMSNMIHDEPARVRSLLDKYSTWLPRLLGAKERHESEGGNGR